MTARGILTRLHRGDADGPPPSRRVIGVAAAVLLALVLLPYFAQPFHVGVATVIVILAVWALSLNVLAGSTGLLSLGHAGLLGVSAYTVAIVQGRWDWPFWAAALVALAATLAVSFVFSLMITRATDVTFLMITLAQGMLVWGLAHRWTSLTGGDNGLRGAIRPEVLGPYWNYYWFALAVAVVVAVALRWFLTSPAGLRLRGIKDSPSRMASLGYSVAVQRLIAFNIAGLVAGVAGILHAGYFQFVSPSTVFLRQSVEGLLMILVGGVGAFTGPIVGAAGIIVARTSLSGVTARWPTIMGLLLILTVLYAPRGLVGHAPDFLRRARRLRSRRPGPNGPEAASRDTPEPSTASDATQTPLSDHSRGEVSAPAGHSGTTS